AGKGIGAQVRTTDILPTILELAGVPIPQKLDGASLAPLFAGAEATSRTVFGQTDYPLRFGWAPLRSVRTEAFKFIEAPKPELYDLKADSGELHSSYTSGDARVAKARGMLAEVRKQEAPQEPKAQSDSGAAGQLKALGYTNSVSGRPAGALADPKD